MDHHPPETMAPDRFGTSQLRHEVIPLCRHLPGTRSRPGNHDSRPCTTPTGLLEVAHQFASIATICKRLHPRVEVDVPEKQ